MTRTLLIAIVIAIATAGSARAQSGHGHQHGGADAQAHQRVEACQREFDQVVADDRGFGLAFPADQNGYPGPLHVLELRTRDVLTEAQRQTYHQLRWGAPKNP